MDKKFTEKEKSMIESGLYCRYLQANRAGNVSKRDMYDRLLKKVREVF